MERHFYSVEYEDGDGDPVIRHGLMTDGEARELVEELARRGVTASVNRLSGTQGEAGVNSSDVDRLLEVGRADQGLDR